MAATLLGVNTTIKMTSGLAGRTGLLGTGDTTLVGPVASDQYVIITGVHVESMGTHTGHVLKIVPNGGTEFPITASATTVSTNLLPHQIYLGPGESLEIAFSGGANGRVGYHGVIFENSP